MPDDDKQPDETRPAAPPEGSEIGEEKDEAADAEQGDKFRPEAIAERVGNIGEETELDRVAREEEAKLTARKKAAKKEKKSALESAASKRLARIGEGKVKRPSAPGVRAGSAAMDGDPLLDRTVRLSEWIQKNQQTFGAVVGVALLGGLGLFGYSYWQNKRNADASALLAAAMADEHGAVAPSKDDDDEETKPAALYPTFATAAERRDAALAAYRKVESRYAGTGAAILARLSEAGLLLDKGDAQGALAAYEDVKASPLAMADAQVRGRALEGMGFAYELLAQTDAAGKDKHLDDALGVYRQLEQFDLKGMKELGMFHEARVLQAKGDKAKAIEVLKDLQKRVSEPGESHPFPYLQAVAEEKLRDLDPSALPPKAPPSSMMGGGGMGGPGGPDMSDPRVQEMWRQIQERMRQQGGGGEPIPVPGGPPPP